VLATKIGARAGMDNLTPETIRRGAEVSLRRLQTDHIDLYYAHVDDPGTPLAETLGAFDELVRSGKVRYIAASNYTAGRLSEALEISAREGLAAYVALQAEYNLVPTGRRPQPGSARRAAPVPDASARRRRDRPAGPGQRSGI
jgi:aryl-alcohol dehydrogenase-like predicted oxidoreductase